MTLLPLSVNLMPDGPVGRIADLAVLAEELGYARCWVYDEGLVTRDVYVTLSAVAERTETIPLGPGITNPFVRHPGATAAAIASLDELSGGRAFVGIGAGGGLTLDPLGIVRDRPLTAVAEMVDGLRRLFAGERVEHDGHAFSFRDAHLTYGRPGIEIILAGRGPRMTELGGRVADAGTVEIAGTRWGLLCRIVKIQTRCKSFGRVLVVKSVLTELTYLRIHHPSPPTKWDFGKT